jgi:putative hydrolase of the HAD superfamily
LRLPATLWYHAWVHDGPHDALASVTVILLDYGGTLDGDARHWFDHFHALYAAAGHPLDADAFKDAFYAADAALEADPEIARFGLERMVTTHVRLQHHRLGLTDTSLAHTIATRFIADTRDAWKRNRALLHRLAPRYRLGVVSNAYGNMPALLAEAALAPFAVVLDSALEGVRKPDPALYERAATRLGLPPSAILHVGDSWERDVVPAHATGMHTAWLAAPAALMPPAPRPVWRLHALGELAMLLP